jgi:uncharacterized tellurite resistance protein B-like protein
MSKRSVILAMAKVLIAAAWADGHLAEDEVNYVKRMLLRLPGAGTGPEGQLTSQEWAELDIYLYAPVDAEERARLVANLAEQLRSPRDREEVLRMLEEIISADRVVTPEERTALDDIRNALNAVDLGLINRIGRLFSAPMRAADPANRPNRELLLEDFLNNRVYFAVRQRLNLDKNADLGIDQEEARTLSLAGALMAYIIHIDECVRPEERGTLERILREVWGIGEAAATMMAEVALSEVARGMDVFQLTSAFADRVPVEERTRLIDALFAVAAADGTLSGAETSEISRINQGIRLTHDQFVAARKRLKLPEPPAA